MSAVTNIFEMCVLFSVVVAASHPRCGTNDFCRAGEFCDTQAEAGASKVGHCSDCYKAKDNSSNLFCASDALPMKCDFLDKSLLTVTPSHLIILIFIGMVLAMEIYVDMHEAIDEKYEFKQVAKHTKGIRYKMLNIYVWWCTRVRTFVIPVQTMGATAALLLNESLSVQNIVLNGAGVGFILRVDDLLGEMMPFSVRYWANEIARYKETVPKTEHRCLVFQACFLWILFITMIVMTEPIMKVWGDETAHGGMPCSDIVNVCRDYPFFMGLVLAYFVSVAKYMRNMYSLKSLAWELSLVTMLGHTFYRTLKFAWTKHMYLQSFSCVLRG